MDSLHTKNDIRVVMLERLAQLKADGSESKMQSYKMGGWTHSGK